MAKWLTIAAAILLLLGGISTSLRWQQNQTPTLQTSYLFPAPKPLSQIQLTDQHGQPFGTEQLKGKWSLFFIGFTSCPDICPTTMGKLTAAYEGLNQYAPLQVIFLSVDPERDSKEKLKNYMAFFNPEFIAVTAPHSQLYPLTRELGMIYTMVGEGQDYTVDHSASMVLVNPQGEKVAVIKPRSEGSNQPHIRLSELVADVQQIQRL
ncbi:electron transporter SenC [Shewanella sp. NFH-SH190041]|uniref:SCO family protein n=1 Tax=Shewanella sp. NFH-SH190041 TaxID=2950245 RepID=UPI0021C3805E|nr:SCO family protein [Shewanella sp. NFH-SH190041]BDM62867.1 electron transporter SenC [Shewanella sp. NFH-SH190041]